MGLHLFQLFLLVTDLTIASTLSCIFYVLACFCLASVIGFVIFLSSFGVIQEMKRNIDQKGKAIRILVSMSVIGGKLLRKRRRKAGFNVLAMDHSLGKEAHPLLKEEWSSNIKGEQLPLTEEKYQKVVQNRIVSQPPLKLLLPDTSPGSSTFYPFFHPGRSSETLCEAVNASLQARNVWNAEEPFSHDMGRGDRIVKRI